MLASKRGKRCAAVFIEHLPMVRVFVSGRRGRTGHALGKQRRVFQRRQLRTPERLIRTRILGLQPANVVGKAPLLRRDLYAGITLQHLAQQQSVAPAIEQQMMVGVNKLLTLIVEAHQRQTQQRRPSRIELQAFAACQQRQLCCLIVTPTPIQHCEWQLHCVLHDLHRRQRAVRPVEATAQNRVRVQGGLPCLSQSLGVQTCDLHAHLIDVSPGLRLIQAVKQQTVLHRRQRVQVVDLPRRHVQLVELGLSQLSQREVRRGDAAVKRVKAMLHQRLQVRFEPRGQGLNSCFVEALMTETQVQLKLAAKHLPVDGQPIGQWRVQTLRRAAGLFGRHKQSVLTKALIKLPQVVERHPRRRQCRKAGLSASVALITQQTKPQAFARHFAQLLFDGLDGCGHVLRRGQLERKQAGKPAHRAGQVEGFKQVFSAVALQLNPGRRLARPVTHCAGQGGKEQVVDLGAVRRRGVLQQLARLLTAEPHAHYLTMAQRLAALGAGARQLTTDALRLLLPPRQLSRQGVAAGIGAQLRGPVLQRAGLWRQGLPGVCRLQVFEQHPPRHTVHHQVVNNEQQALSARVVINQHHPH